MVTAVMTSVPVLSQHSGIFSEPGHGRLVTAAVVCCWDRELVTAPSADHGLPGHWSPLVTRNIVTVGVKPQQQKLSISSSE